jgi:uncharacterized membrane protein
MDPQIQSTTGSVDPQKTASGLDPNVAAALSYALGWVTGLVFYLTEPANTFVRFHAMQSIVVFGVVSAMCVLLQIIPLLGLLIVIFVVFPVSAVLWLLLMFKAYNGERFKMPIAGDIAEQRQ